MIDAVGGFVVGLATGYLFTWPSLVILLILGTLFEYGGARGWAVFIGLVSIVTAFFFFSVSGLRLAEYVGLYAVIGIVWSIWRYKRFVEVRVEEIRNSDQDDRYKAYDASKLHPSKNLDTITAWIIIWPFSFIESITGDLIAFVQTLVTKVFNGIYNKIYNAAVGDLIKK